jgi:hypothetical protein
VLRPTGEAGSASAVPYRAWQPDAPPTAGERPPGHFVRLGTGRFGEAERVLAHGGTAGLALELAIVLVPLLFIVALLWWGKRRERAGPDGSSGSPGRKDGGP